jgi:hypothetical protein
VRQPKVLQLLVKQPTSNVTGIVWYTSASFSLPMDRVTLSFKTNSFVNLPTSLSCDFAQFNASAYGRDLSRKFLVLLVTQGK